MSSERREKIAQAAFAFFTQVGPDLDGGDPYVFEVEPKDLRVSLDGRLYCRALASAIDAALPDDAAEG